MKIKLLKNHRHSGVDHVVGDLLEVDESTAEWLANLKVAAPAGASASTSAPIQGKRGSSNQAVMVPETPLAVTADSAEDSSNTPTEVN